MKFNIVDAREYALNDRQRAKKTYLVKDGDSSINGKPVYARILICPIEETFQANIGGGLMKTKVNKITPEMLAFRIVKMFDRYKLIKPNAKITVETPDKTVTCKLTDALIYVNDFNDIVIDSE